jgi:hypothetical protein
VTGPTRIRRLDHAIKNSTACDGRSLKAWRRVNQQRTFLRTCTGRPPGLPTPSADSEKVEWRTAASLKCPLLAHDTSTMVRLKICLQRAARPNLLIKIPGTKRVFLQLRKQSFGYTHQCHPLFSLVGNRCRSISPRNRATHRCRPQPECRFSSIGLRKPLTGRYEQDARRAQPLGIAIAKRTYGRAHLRPPRWQRVYNLGARPQRLLGALEPSDPNMVFGNKSPPPFTVNTMPEGTQRPRDSHRIGRSCRRDGGDVKRVGLSARWVSTSTPRLRSFRTREPVHGRLVNDPW